MSGNSRFLVSLDFELMWGVRDKRTIDSYGQNILGVRKAIPGMLDLFHEFGIRSTFATVGFLFARDKDELLSHIPEEKPLYSNPRYSPYENGYVDSIGRSEKDDPYHFGYSLVRMIQECGGQEIGTHTFSHYYCLEGASLSSFEADLSAAIKIASTNNISISSIIFPRNQYSDAHLDICRKKNIIVFRGNEAGAVFQPRKNEELNPVIRATRMADSYINITGDHAFSPSVLNGGIVNLPASRFLRPYSAKLSALDPLRKHRIRQSMTHAAKNDTCYHLWWHPHNFGKDLQENLSFLRSILDHYKMLNEKFGMLSDTMTSIANTKLNRHEV